MSEENTTTLDYPLKSRLRDFYDDYFSCLEAQDLSVWPSFFTDDATYLIQSEDSHRRGLLIGDIYCEGIAMFRDRAAATINTSIHARQTIRHFPGALKFVVRNGQRVSSAMSYLAVRSAVDEPPAVFSTGRSIDEVCLQGDRIRFSDRKVIYDHGRIDNSLVFPL